MATPFTQVAVHFARSFATSWEPASFLSPIVPVFHDAPANVVPDV
ncbi:hypothetical protein [Methylobacterium sp. W2]|nr:hypothetical protein [Methylobacterium sp. W2]